MSSCLICNNTNHELINYSYEGKNIICISCFINIIKQQKKIICITCGAEILKTETKKTCYTSIDQPSSKLDTDTSIDLLSSKQVTYTDKPLPGSIKRYYPYPYPMIDNYKSAEISDIQKRKRALCSLLLLSICNLMLIYKI